MLPFPEVLFRVHEIFLVPVRTEYPGSLLAQPDGAVRVVAEVVGEQDRYRPAARDLVEVVRGLAGAGVDQHDALRPFDGIDDAAVLKSVDTFFDSFPVGRHGSEAPWFVSSDGPGRWSRSVVSVGGLGQWLAGLTGSWVRWREHHAQPGPLCMGKGPRATLTA